MPVAISFGAHFCLFGNCDIRFSLSERCFLIDLCNLALLLSRNLIFRIGFRKVKHTYLEISRAMNSSGEKPKSRGAFIVFEGPDRSGKSTQSKMLFQKLLDMKIPVEFMRFPDRNASNELGSRISRYLRKEIQLSNIEAHTIFTEQRFHEKERMEKLLSNGVTLVVDRYSDSGIAYSAAKGLDVKWCKDQEAGLLIPDLVVYMKILPEEAGKRGGFGDEVFETYEFQKKVCEAYSLLQDDDWMVIDATRPADEIFKDIEEVAMVTVRDCQDPPLPLNRSDSDSSGYGSDPESSKENVCDMFRETEESSPLQCKTCSKLAVDGQHNVAIKV